MSKLFVSIDDVNVERIAEGVYRQILAFDSKIMLIKVKFNTGTSFPDHNHPHQQITHIVKGKFKVTISGESKILISGDSYIVPENAIHKVECIIKGELYDIFSPMREDFLQ